MDLNRDNDAYRDAGVSRDAAETTVSFLSKIAKSTYDKNVVEGVGGFGAIYRLNNSPETLLVSSTDGVGTKSRISVALNEYEKLGHDVVNACVNDVLTTGADPLFFLDYIATGELVADIIARVGRGIGEACKISECSLIGGETAEMPGIYSNKDIEIVGFSVGVVSESNLLKSSSVNVGDIVLGLPSNGIHTNGFSLIRNKLNLDNDSSLLTKYFDELKCELGQALTTPHKPYHPLIKQVKRDIKSMAHITGGGISENLPRALPDDLAANIALSSWDIPILFKLLQKLMEVDVNEMFKVFNMGLGMILIATSKGAINIQSILPEVIVIGEIQKRNGGEQVIFG